jgi:predicted enzyme related to lactoylglutathione lyase
VFETNGEMRAGLVTIPNDDIEPAWAPYLLVDDLDTVLRRTPKLGGTVVAEPDRFSSRGEVALIADPTGAAFFVYQRAEKGAAR